LEETILKFKKKGIEEPRLNAEIILSSILKKPRSYLYLESEYLISPSRLCLLKKLVRRRSSHIPLSYTIREQDFMGLKFRVTPAVFIPRPETEILVEKVVKILQKEPISRKQNIIIDLGTGCGNIAISIAKQLNDFKIYAVEISKSALEVAFQNARRHRVEKRITFLWGDVFSPLRRMNLRGRVRLVISNPPYIAGPQIKRLSPEVRKEPLIALNGGRDGLKFFKRIIQEAPLFLGQGGLLALEMGYNQAGKVEKLIIAQKEFESPEFIYDYEGIQRVIISRRI